MPTSKLSSILFITWLVGCSGGPTAPDSQPNQADSTPTITTFPYESMGAGTFWFASGSTNYLVDSRTRSFTTLSKLGLEYDPQMSPDGKLFVYVALVDGPYGPLRLSWDIRVTDWSNKAVTLYSQNEASATVKNPTWSYDGSSVFYDKWTDTKRTIERVSLADRATRSLDAPCSEMGRVSESATGTLIFSCGSSVVSLRPDGAVTTIARHPSWETVYTPVWSPDGTRIAYGVHGWDTVNNRDTMTIRVISSSGTSLAVSATLTTRMAKVDDPAKDAICWSSDGTRILFYTLRDDGASGIYSIRSDGTGLTEVAPSYFLSCGG